MLGFTSLKSLQISLAHHAGIGVRQQSGFFQDGAASLVQIIERALMAALGQEAFHLGIDRFRLIAEAKQDFSAAEQLALLHHAQHFFERHGLGAGFVRRLAKGAIAAKIPAQIGQRHENLRRKSDDAPLVPIAQLRRRGEQGLHAHRPARRQGLALRRDLTIYPVDSFSRFAASICLNIELADRFQTTHGIDRGNAF